MAQGGGQTGGMGGSPMGGQPSYATSGSPMVSPPQGGFGPGVNNFGGGYNSTNSTTTQDMMGGGNGMSFGQTMGQLGMMGGQQGGYGGGYNPMPQQFGFGPNPNNFGSPQGMMPPPSPRFAQFGGPEYERGYPQPQGPRGFNQGPRTEDDWNRFSSMARFAPGTDMEKAKADFLAQGNQMPQQGMGQIPKFSSPFFQQMQQMQQMQQLQNQNKPDPLANPTPAVNPAPAPPPTPAPQKRLPPKQQRKADRLARRNPVPAPAPTDFSKMGQAGQFGTQGFAQGLQDYAGQQYKDYAYNPTNQTFYKGGDKASQGVSLGQILQQGRAAGYKMASGGIASLRRR